ncbi:uncharacterized protein LOC123527932 [Mercenaria mercenaria]|uniref:uncharacterized protein LOC123527932 n=1 Tax=Mercenaria mercenaria TaxID=6596 RepID=UPI00234E646F|nr:uncharacterized protein LOC123527932 [Mercenaria mercenaria]
MTFREQMTCKTQIAVLCVLVNLCLYKAGVAGQSTCALSLEPEPAKVILKEGLTYTDDSVLTCSDGKCGKIPLRNIQNAYPDSFSSQEVAENNTGLQFNDYIEKVPSACALEKQSAKSSLATYISPTCRRFWSDRDGCCPTWRYVTFHKGPLRNISGRKCYILQIPFLRLYQYISVGICGWMQECSGRCKQQYTVQSMLAWCPGYSGLKMHHFRIPTYCSCQKS